VHGEDEDWSGPCTDDSKSDDDESEYDEGDSESGDHYSGEDPSSKGGPANRLRIMTMEELEEMEPGFAISYNRHDRPLYTSEYDSEYDEESSEYDSEYTTGGSHSDQDNYDSEDDLDRGLSKWRSGRGEIDGSKETYTRATNQGGCSFPQGAN
jgi:hypothetical protein